MEKLCNQIENEFITNKNKHFRKPNNKYQKILTTNKTILLELNQYIKQNIDFFSENLVYSLSILYDKLDNTIPIVKLLQEFLIASAPL